MYQRILVPLDGSPFAERALEPAFDIARAFGCEVVLLRVVSPEEMLEVTPALATHLSHMDGFSLRHEEEAAATYLCQMKGRWAWREVPVRTQVVPGTPAEAIVGAAHAAAADLIVMSTHGRSAVGRIIYGSIAEAVLRGAQLPVLLIPVRVPA
jgi:nucleotide-binding universal stress UspA family protein